MTLSFDFIGIVARDVPASVRFYRLLGIEIPEGAELEPHVEVTLPNGMRLGWDSLETIRSFDESYEPPTGSHHVAFAFQAGNAAEVDETFVRLTGAGYVGRVAPWDAFWGQRYATIIDPDGNAIDLYASLAEQG